MLFCWGLASNRICFPSQFDSTLNCYRDFVVLLEENPSNAATECGGMQRHTHEGLVVAIQNVDERSRGGSVKP